MFGEKEKIHVYIGSDHAGFQTKEVLKDFLGGEFHVTDLGAFSEEPVDYPDIAREVSEKVLENHGAMGVVICGTGTGMAMTANKLRGIRAAVATNEFVAEMARKHNNANVLALGARVNNIDELKKIVDKFVHTEFEASEERHVRRVNKIDGK